MRSDVFLNWWFCGALAGITVKMPQAPGGNRGVSIASAANVQADSPIILLMGESFTVNPRIGPNVVRAAARTETTGEDPGKRVFRPKWRVRVEIPELRLLAIVHAVKNCDHGGPREGATESDNRARGLGCVRKPI